MQESTKQRNAIRLRLTTNNLTQTWLIAQLAEAGIVTDKSELSSALSGSRTGEKITNILSESLVILDKYEKAMNVQG